MKGKTTGLKPLQRLIRLLSLDRQDIFYLYVYAVFAGIISLSLPLGFQAIITFIAAGQFTASWGLLVMVVTLGTALGGLLKVLQMIISETIQQRIFARSSFEFALRIPRFRLESILGEYPPELINRFFDTMTIQKGLSKILLEFSTAIVEIIFGLVLLSIYHPIFLIMSVVIVLITIIILYLTGPIGLKTSLKESSYKYEVAHWLEELARSMSTFKQAGDTKLPIDKTDELVKNYLYHRKKHFKILVAQFGSVVVLKTMVTAALLIIGGSLVASNQINIGQFVASEIIIILVVKALEKLMVSMENVYDVLTAVEKIGQVSDLPLEIDTGIDFETIDTGKGIDLKIENLEYHYEGNDSPTLKGVSLEVKPHERICIAGFGGSGKSTLLKIVAGEFRNYKGMVTYNGIPLRNITPRSLHTYVGDVSEDEDLFQGTIYENITVGHPMAGITEVIEASRAVGLEPVIQRSPLGYDTEVLPAGRGLSQSVILKIILARAVACRPSLITLEEGLQKLTQEERIIVYDYLVSEANNWSLLAVSNDPELASRCDKVLVMEDGKIIAEGSFAEISKLPYANKLFANQ